MINNLLKFLVEETEQLKLSMTNGVILLLIDSSAPNISTPTFNQDKFYAVKKVDSKESLKAVRAELSQDQARDVEGFAVFDDKASADDTVIIHVSSDKTRRLIDKISFIAVAKTENDALEVLDKNPKLVSVKKDYEQGKQAYPVYVKLTH